MTIIINPYATVTQIVGQVPISVVNYYSIQSIRNDVYLPPGVLKHLQKRGHWPDFLKYHQDIPNIISTPDYAGQNPKEPGTIELYKTMSDHVLLAIKMNPTTGLFIGSFYTLDNGASKIQKRLRVGRIFPFSHFQ